MTRPRLFGDFGFGPRYIPASDALLDALMYRGAKPEAIVQLADCRAWWVIDCETADDGRATISAMQHADRGETVAPSGFRFGAVLDSSEIRATRVPIMPPAPPATPRSMKIGESVVLRAAGAAPWFRPFDGYHGVVVARRSDGGVMVQLDRWPEGARRLMPNDHRARWIPIARDEMRAVRPRNESSALPHPQQETQSHD